MNTIHNIQKVLGVWLVDVHTPTCGRLLINHSGTKEEAVLKAFRAGGIMYRCEICGVVLPYQPCRPVRNRMPDGFWETGVDLSCPYCESGPVVEYSYEGGKCEHLRN